MGTNGFDRNGWNDHGNGINFICTAAFNLFRGRTERKRFKSFFKNGTATASECDFSTGAINFLTNELVIPAKAGILNDDFR